MNEEQVNTLLVELTWPGQKRCGLSEERAATLAARSKTVSYMLAELEKAIRTDPDPGLEPSIELLTSFLPKHLEKGVLPLDPTKHVALVRDLTEAYAAGSQTSLTACAAILERYRLDAAKRVGKLVSAFRQVYMAALDETQYGFSHLLFGNLLWIQTAAHAGENDWIYGVARKLAGDIIESYIGMRHEFPLTQAALWIPASLDFDKNDRAGRLFLELFACQLNSTPDFPIADITHDLSEIWPDEVYVFMFQLQDESVLSRRKRVVSAELSPTGYQLYVVQTAMQKYRGFSDKLTEK